MKLKSICIILGLFAFIIAITAAISFGGGSLMFIHIPSLAFVLAAGGSLGMACYRGGGFLEYIKACKKHFISAGVLITIISTIQMLRNLFSPDSIGAGVAVGLLPIFYGIILYCITDAITT